MKYLKKPINHKTIWTKKDKFILINCVEQKMNYKDIAQLLGRTLKACRQQFYILNKIKTIHRTKWTKQNNQDLIILKLIVECSMDEMIQILNRTKYAITRQYYKILKSPSEHIRINYID